MATTSTLEQEITIIASNYKRNYLVVLQPIRSDDVYTIQYSIPDLLIYQAEDTKTFLLDIISNIFDRFNDEVGINLNPDQKVLIHIKVIPKEHCAGYYIYFQFEIIEPDRNSITITNGANSIFNIDSAGYELWKDTSFSSATPLTFEAIEEVIKKYE